MSKNKYIYITSIAVLCAYCGIAGSAVMSKYGEIQSVKNYSSNPFWTPDSPYNMRMPTPIYATGPDLNTETCNNTVAALVSSYCSSNNNCTNKQLSDVRPTIMVQLSQLPGANYATSCGGYIDSAFKNYKKKHGNLSTGINIVQTSKPKTTLTLTPATNSTKATKTDGVAERTAELERLQSITTPSSQLTAADFPKTIADISFVDRVANATAGYEPYKDLKAYKIPKFETEQEYYARMESVLKHDINYETYKGRPTKQSPTSYLTGRGAKIAWTPSRDYSIFRGWCADESLTLKPDECDTNCQMTPSIDPMDRADKMFYACWECEAGHTLVNNHYCDCPDPDYMDPKKNCDCIKKPGLQKSSDGMKCECKNGMDITSGCKCVGPYTTQNPTTHQCECVSPYKQVDSSDINKGCECIDPNGDPANNCQVTCPDMLMDPTDNCKCPTGTRQSGNECVCENGTGNPPDCTCPDPNADHKDPTASCACYPSDFMGSDCGCWGMSTWDDTNKKCVCPIRDTSNLNIDEWAIAAATCQCPSTKPKFNSTAKRCEGGTPEDECPSSAYPSGTYLMYTCISDSQFAASTRVTKKSIASSLDCKEHNNNRHCMSSCGINRTFTTAPGGATTETTRNWSEGTIHKLLGLEKEKFCTGTFFNTINKWAWSGVNIMKPETIIQEFDETEICRSVKIIKDNLSSIQSSCTFADSKLSGKKWLIYILKKDGSDYVIQESIKIN